MRMKLSRTALLILGTGIFVIAFGILFMGYSQQSGEQERVEEELSAAQELLPQLISEKEDWESQLTQLESQLTQATSSLNSSKARFPQAVESIEYDEELFLIAHACDLEITNLTASEPTDLEVEDVIYTVTYFEVEVQGEISDMLCFINTIATGEYFTPATIELVEMEVPELEGAEGNPSVTITLVIYSYQGE